MATSPSAGSTHSTSGNSSSTGKRRTLPSSRRRRFSRSSRPRRSISGASGMPVRIEPVTAAAKARARGPQVWPNSSKVSSRCSKAACPANRRLRVLAPSRWPSASCSEAMIDRPEVRATFITSTTAPSSAATRSGCGTSPRRSHLVIRPAAFCAPRAEAPAGQSGDVSCSTRRRPGSGRVTKPPQHTAAAAKPPMTTGFDSTTLLTTSAPTGKSISPAGNSRAAKPAGADPAGGRTAMSAVVIAAPSRPWRASMTRLPARAGARRRRRTSPAAWR